MTMRIYKSTDASAPTLQGIVGGAYSSGWADGSLLQLLEKVLVDGYGSKTAAGWTLSFTGTSEGVFRQGAGCQFYLHVLDDASMTATGKEANFYGAESMTALSTGTGKFPTVSQQANGLFFRKSDTASSVQRPWICFADNKTFYLFSWPSGQAGDAQTTNYYAGMAFGDFYSYVSGDAYNCIAIGRITTSLVDTLTNENLDTYGNTVAARNGHYIARGYNQLGTSVQVGKTGGGFFPSISGTGPAGNNQALAYPNPSDGKLWLSRAYITDSVTLPTSSVRGFLRGFWAIQSQGNLVPMEYTINGTGGLAGRTFRILGLQTGGGTNGRYTMETSDTWD